MPPMNHEAIREWIDDAFLAPGMRDDDDPAARAVRAHLATCTDCGTYDEATRRAALKLDMARGPSPDVRARTLAATHRLAGARAEDARPAGAPGRGGGLSWRLASLVLAIAVLGAGAGAWWANAARQDSHLAESVAMMSTIATMTDAHELVLRDGAGNGNGIVVMSAGAHQMAVFATHLPAGVKYHCYIEHDGQRTRIGGMYADQGVQFWAGDMDAAMEMAPGDLLIVAADDDAPAVLTATL
jgi:hypothetical protein